MPSTAGCVEPRTRNARGRESAFDLVPLAEVLPNVLREIADAADRFSGARFRAIAAGLEPRPERVAA